jgi:ATP/maltotriose-dependent transcriptional regulator MalT/DNA-binding SARP family transcriptional activator
MSGVPAPAAHELRRDRLLEVLHKHRATPLILLVAPAGFGKSTLAATYARDSGGAVGWLTLHTADRDSRRLFARLADALDAGFGEPGSLPALRRGLAEGAEGVGLARLLLNDLVQAPTGFIIVLDDFAPVAESEDVVAAIDALIRDLPEAGQVLISAREAPGLSMTRMVVEDTVFAYGTEDLRFSPDETKALREAIGGDPSRDQQAEGWVAGILLGGAPRQLNIGGASLLGWYVEREVLSRLSATEQSWLQVLSVFDAITPHAAERMLGAANWPSRLLALAERCPFLVARQDGTYRLHALVRETMLSLLRRSPDERGAQAWEVARQLAEEASDPEAVVHACQELGQIDRAVEVVRRVATEDVQTGRWPTVLVTLELLPEDVRRADPDLSLTEARARLNTGHSDQAYEAAEATLRFGGRTGDVRVQVSALIELAFATFASDLAAAEDWLAAADHLLRQSELPADRKHLLDGRALGVRGICAQIRGDIATAREHFENGERLLALLGPSRDLSLIQQNFGSFCNRTGDYAKAQKCLASAASQWRLMRDRNGLATTQTILGDLHLRLGNLDAAGEELNDALEAARAVGSLRMEAFAIVSLGQWHRANGRLNESVAAFDEGLRLAEEIVERELVADALVLRAEVALLREDRASARELLARAQAEAQRIGSNATQAAVDRALGRLHLVEGSDSRAVSHLEAALERAGAGWGPDQRAETLYWLGTAYLSLGRAHQATAHLEQAIGLLEQLHLPALLAGPAAEDPRLLQHGRLVGLNPVMLADVDRLAATRRPWTGLSQPPVSLLVQNDLPRIEVQLFGSFVLHRDGQLMTNVSRKVDRVRELAAILILHPKGMRDEAIAEWMFPDMQPERALHNLQMAASTLRKELGSKAGVRYNAHTYQLSPQLEVLADVRDFDAALAKARVATGDALIQALSRALALYRGPLLADAGWDWLEEVRLDYRSRYVSAAMQLADIVAPIDPARSDSLAEEVLAVAPETDVAYERLLQNARELGDATTLRRVAKRYAQAAAQFGFSVDPYLLGAGQKPRVSRRAEGGRKASGAPFLEG